MIAVLLLVLSSMTRAQDLQNAVVVWYGSQEQYCIFTESAPVFTVVNGSAVLSADGDFEYKGYTVSFEYTVPLSESTPYRVTFEKRAYQGFTPDEVGVRDIKAESLRPQFSIQGGSLRVNALKPGSQVSLFTLDGKKLATAKADQSGRVQAQLPKTQGTVVVRATDGINFKILVK